MSSAGNTSSGSSTRSLSTGSTPSPTQTTPLPTTPTPTQPTPTPTTNRPSTPTPTPTLTTPSPIPPTTSSASKPGWSNVPLDPGEHYGGGGGQEREDSRAMQIVIPVVSTIAAIIFLVGAYRLALYLRHRRQQKSSVPLPPPRVPNMLARKSVIMEDFDMAPPLFSATTPSGSVSLQGSSRTVSTIGGRSPLLVNDQPITASGTPFPASSSSSSAAPSEEFDYTKPIPRRPRPVSSAANRHSVFSIASNRNSVHATPHRTSLRGAPHHSRIDIVLPEPLGPSSGLPQPFYPPRRVSNAHIPNELGLYPQAPRYQSSSRTSPRLRSYTPEDIDNESVTAPSSSHHHTQEYTLPPVPPLPSLPSLALSPFLTPDTPLFDPSAIALPVPPPPSSPNTNATPAPAPVPASLTVTTTTTETRSASIETAQASSLPSPAESSPTTLTTKER